MGVGGFLAGVTIRVASLMEAWEQQESQGSRVVCPTLLLLLALTQSLGVGGYHLWLWDRVVGCPCSDGVESPEFHGPWVPVLLLLGTEPGSLPMCS